MATPRRDGLAFYTPHGTTASPITAPIQKAAGEDTLSVNARGALTAQILDPYLRPLEAAQPWRGDGARVPLLDLRAIEGPFRLSFRLEEGAELHTFSLGPADGLPDPDLWE